MRTYVVALLLAIGVLSSCGNPLIPPEDSLITGWPCSPPCWSRLTPGVSSYDEVKEYISTLSSAEKRSLTVREGEKDYVSFTWDGLRNKALRRLTVSSGRLALVTLTPDFNLRLGAVTDRLGPPEYVKAELGIGPDVSVYALEVYYPQQGLALVLEPRLEDAGTVRREMPVKTIYYFAPDDLKSFFITRFSLGEREDQLAEIVEKSYLPKLQPWPGYGPVTLK